MSAPDVMARSPSGDYLLIENGVMTGTNVLSSNAVNVGIEKHVAIDAVWTDTPGGAFAIMGGNFLSDLRDISDQFTPIPPDAGGAAGSFITYGLVRTKYIQFKYTNATGTGALNVRMQVKQ